MDWARILAYVTGTVDQELLARNEYLAAENRILKAQLKGRLKLSDAERATLGEIGHRLGRKVLGEVANAARDGCTEADPTRAWLHGRANGRARANRACDRTQPARGCRQESSQAMSEYVAAGHTVRAKTARLKEQRLA